MIETFEERSLRKELGYTIKEVKELRKLRYTPEEIQEYMRINVKKSKKVNVSKKVVVVKPEPKKGFMGVEPSTKPHKSENDEFSWWMVLVLFIQLGGMIGFFITGFILTVCFLFNNHGFLALIMVIVGITWFVFAYTNGDDSHPPELLYSSFPILAFLFTCIIYGMLGGVGIAAIPLVFIGSIIGVCSALPVIAVMFGVMIVLQK